MARLMVLQGFDNEAKRLRDEMIALPKLVAQLDAKAKATAGQRAVVLDLIAKEDALRRRQESDVKDQQAKIARARKQMDAATTTVQVTAYEHEIAFAQKAISTLEDAELESMERSEEMEAQRRVADVMLDEAVKKHAAESTRTATTVAQDKLLLAEVEGRRTAQRKTVGEDALSLYDRIAKAKGAGIAEARDQKCSACQMLVRPQRWNDLRERDNTDLWTCESCGRLLYYDPARDSPQKKPVEYESIAARIVREG